MTNDQPSICAHGLSRNQTENIGWGLEGFKRHFTLQKKIHILCEVLGITLIVIPVFVGYGGVGGIQNGLLQYLNTQGTGHPCFRPVCAHCLCVQFL